MAEKALIETSKGDITIELYPDKAPKTVENFLAYVREGYYDGTIFHRVIPDFMIQGGGLTEDMRQKPTRPPIVNEATNGLKNERGTVAMARTREIDSATAQFFINVPEAHEDQGDAVADNAFLNHKSKSPRGFGYAVFGRVVEGMEVVDRIAQVPTTTVGPFRNVPREPVVIERATVVAPAGETAAQ